MDDKKGTASLRSWSYKSFKSTGDCRLSKKPGQNNPYYAYIYNIHKHIYINALYRMHYINII